MAAVSMRFEELDYAETPIGAISLRRRLDPVLDIDVYEVKLGEEYLMSSLFVHAEEELARLGLAAVNGSGLAVVVGGLGLGYTARAALHHDRTGSLWVVETLAEVIGWHRRELLPTSRELNADVRSQVVGADFFALARSGAGFDPMTPGRRFDVVLLDVDHSPSRPLHPSHADFYQPAGLRRLADQLEPGGALAVWSNDPPEDDFVAALTEVFGTVDAHVVSFPNPLQQRDATNTVYVASAHPPDTR